MTGHRSTYSLELLLPGTPSSRLSHRALARYCYSTKAVASNTTTSASPPSISKGTSLALNPPPSARSPPLDLPTRLPDQPAYNYYYKLTRAYGGFYTTGFKNLYQNFKLGSVIARRLESYTYEEDLRNGLISRGDWHLVTRQRADAFRMPLFILVFVIFGEWTPLVAVFFSGAIPRSLWVPKQVQKAREKSEARRSEVFRNPPAGLDIDRKETEPEILPLAEVLHLGRSLGLYSSLWDRIDLPPLWLIRRRIKKRMDFVALDDLTIRRDGGVEGLEDAEVCLAAEVRGLDVLGRKESDLRRELSLWLLNGNRLAKRGLSPRRLYLTRPSAWPHHHLT